MNLPNNLFNIVVKKLNLQIFLFDKKKFHLKNITKKTVYLKKNNFRINLSKFSNSNNLIVSYIVSIHFLKNTTTLHISNVQGDKKLFISAGLLKLKGKQKKQRRLAISRLVKLITKKAPYILTKPIALHFKNVNFYKNFIINKLKNFLYIRILKNFNQIPYNGCKKPKLQRKKYAKQFK